MRRLITCSIIACLAFALGYLSDTAWERRQRIIDYCAELLANYQD